MNKKPTQELYSTLQNAYDYFNQKLFSNELPQALIVAHRKKGAYGYYWPGRWVNGENELDEIALNPDTMGRTIEEVFATLVHEMVHLWQQHFDKPSRNGYHNKRWANKMEQIGLMPTSTGGPDGKKTGQKVTHFIMDDGPFFVAFKSSPFKSKELWHSFKLPKASKQANKQKFTCQGCQQKAWGKPDLFIVCGICNEEMVAL